MFKARENCLTKTSGMEQAARCDSGSVWGPQAHMVGVPDKRSLYRAEHG